MPPTNLIEPTHLITPPDLEMDFETITEAQILCQFNFAAPGWYYRDGGRSCLLLTNDGNHWTVRVWNAMDPIPELRKLVELSVHHV